MPPEVTLVPTIQRSPRPLSWLALSALSSPSVIDRTPGSVTNRAVSNARKAMCEAMIKEIVIVADDAVRPIFKLPLAGHDEGLALDGPALSGSKRAVRALPTLVGDTGIEPVASLP